MTNEQETLAEVQEAVRRLPPALEEATNELAYHIEMQIERAGPPVGQLAIALVGAKLACISLKAGE